jgi:hypothetical protein
VARLAAKQASAPRRRPQTRRPARARPFPNCQPLSELTPSDSERIISVLGSRDRVLRAVALILNTVRTVTLCRAQGARRRRGAGAPATRGRRGCGAAARRPGRGRALRARARNSGGPLTGPLLPLPPSPISKSARRQLSADDKFGAYMDLTLQLASTQARMGPWPRAWAFGACVWGSFPIV